jgi:urate oxidase
VRVSYPILFSPDGSPAPASGSPFVPVPPQISNGDDSWVNRSPETVARLEADVTRDGSTVDSGLTDLVVLKSTGSEFKGFLTDEFTTLAETDDRVLATSLSVSWRWSDTALEGGVEWNAAYGEIRSTLLELFATTYSRALQETLWAMGRAVLERQPGVAEISFTAPNKHHHLVDLSPFGLDNPGEVFIAADRPYGLIEATVTREEDR